MITGENLDRRYWIGASDTMMVMGKRSGSTYQDWWYGKTGLRESTGNSFSNIYTRAGDLYEKPIARAFGEDVTEDRTILLPEYSLRVNLDADTPKKIIECKTYKAEKGILDRRSQTYRRYFYQVQVQQFAWEMYFGEPIEAEMRIYYLNNEDYEATKRGIVLPIDMNRIDSRKIVYDRAWIDGMYLPKLMPLAKILKGLRDAA